MSFLTVDRTKCKSDAFCVAECPVKILAMDEQGKFPVSIAAAEEFCIQCGHCVAVCPHGALSLDGLPIEQFQQLPTGWNLTPQHIEYLLKGRRSIRTYKKDAVERSALEKIIDIARYAPSGINRQPVRWLVMEDAKKVHELARLVVEWSRSLLKEKAPIAESLRMQQLVSAWDKGEDRICRGALHLVFAYALKDDMIAPQAATIALTYLELAAVSFGLGTCWAGYVHIALNQSPKIQEFVGINKRCSCLGAMMIGHPRYRYNRIPPRSTPDIKWK